MQGVIEVVLVLSVRVLEARECPGWARVPAAGLLLTLWLRRAPTARQDARTGAERVQGVLERRPGAHWRLCPARGGQAGMSCFLPR